MSCVGGGPRGPGTHGMCGRRGLRGPGTLVYIYFYIHNDTEAKAKEWSERCRLRSEELLGIKEAIDILTGGRLGSLEPPPSSS
eukprot:9178734-Karenia_brevis.AAC.1